MTEWDKFFKDKITKFFKETEQVIDIGGGLRINKSKNNRFNKNNLYYYYPMKGYYKDYYRFTKDGMKYLLKDFSFLEIQNVRGALYTVFNLIPLVNRYFSRIFYFLDKLFNKNKTNQTSGYNVFCIK